MKLLSLFDGSGGFPLAASMCGITPVMAAEVEPYPIAVTKSRFPKMKHLGNVQNIHGNEIEPVDIITFGSPCQDLSVAGKRKGLKHAENGDDETTRSGLFLEAVRIIKEMREATNGIYPRYAVWENVPGAFSSNKGEDFRTVLDELIKISEPDAVMPDVPKAGWAYADCYSGDRWSLAYRVFDAQYWGVPQRRRRIYLVADFRGQRAKEILFVKPGLRGYFEKGRTPWQEAAGNAESGIGADDREGTGGLILDDQGGQQINVRTDGKSPTLRAEMHGNVPCVLMDAYQHHGWREGETCGTLTAESNNHVRGDTPLVIEQAAGFKAGQSKAGGIGWQDETAATLSAQASGTEPTVCIKKQYLFENHSQDTRFKGPLKVCPMLPAQLGTGGNNTPFVVEDTPVYCLQGNGIDRALTAGCNGKGWKEGQSYTPNTTDRPAVAYAVGNGQANQVYLQDKMGALNCMHDQQAIVLDRAFFNQGQNAQYKPQFYADGTCPTLVAKGPHAVQIRYIVRRLTPTECARLQGFPDKWGHPDKKETLTDDEYRFWLEVRNTHAAINGKAVKEYTKAQMLTWYNKLHSDSAEYKMWGNGIALPNALYVMQGIVGG